MYHPLNQLDAKLTTNVTWEFPFSHFSKYFPCFPFEFSLADDDVNLFFRLVPELTRVLQHSVFENFSYNYFHSHNLRKV